MAESKFTSRKALAGEFGINVKTFDKRIQSIKFMLAKPDNEKAKRLYNPNEANIIRTYLRGL